MTKEFSLSDLDATKASSAAFEFEFILADGSNSGVFLSVLGGQSERVAQEVASLVNERRRKHAARQTQAAMRNKAAPEFDSLESDVEFGQRLAAVRLVGWRGIKEAYTPEGALKLCKSNRDIAAQVTEASDNLANFMKL